MNRPIIKKEEIKSARLILKPESPRDVDALVELFQNPCVTKTFMIPEYETREEYVKLANMIVSFADPKDTEHLEYGIYFENRLIGFLNDCGIEENSIEIGYVIHPDQQGKGFATEAVKAILPELKEMGFTRVEAGYFEENPASCRVMEKCGMHKIDKVEFGEYRGKQHKCLYCEITF